MNGKLFVISGPSGSGKTTLANHAVDKFANLNFSVSCTTREKREEEIEGVHYSFISKEDFIDKRECDFFAEWAVVHGNYYGTPIININESIDSGKDILLDVDVQGANKLKKKFNDAVFIFVVPPSIKHLEKRLKKRNSDKSVDISLRMNVVKDEIKQSINYDYIIINNRIDTAKKEIESIMIAEKNGQYGEDLESGLSDSIRSKKVYDKFIVERFDIN